MNKTKKGLRSGLEKYNNISITTNIIFSLIAIVFALLCLLPVILAMSISFTSEANLNINGYQFIPEDFSLEAYKIIFGIQSGIPRALLVSVVTTFLGTALGIFLNSTYAYLLTQKKFKFQRFALIYILIPMLFSGGLIPSYMINKGFLKLGDTWTVLIVLGAVSSFNIIIIKTFFEGQLGDSILEQADIDGAGHFRKYFQIVLPLSKPVLATIAIFLAFGYWNSWMTASLYIENRPDLKPLQAILMEIEGTISFLKSPEGQKSLSNMGADIVNIPSDPIRMALVVIIVVPIALVYPFFQRYFTSSLMIGAIKG